LDILKDTTDPTSECKDEKQYTLYWIDGHREIVLGKTLRNALLMAGHSRYAHGALSSYAIGDDHSMVWDDDAKVWHQQTDGGTQ
jgi:hypothetical protein